MARTLLRLFHLGLFLALLGGGIVAWGYGQFVKPGPLPAAVAVVVPKGVGLRGIAEELARQGVIESPLLFRLGARLIGAGGSLRAGEYMFPAKISPREAVALLQSGRTVVRRLTIVEGLTTAEIVRQLNATEGLDGRLDEPPGEGTLLPETYFFSYGDSRTELVARMRDGMRRLLGDLWLARADGLAVRSQREALILASIVEKETGVASERSRVAAVFHNRLRLGMRLQSDPTVAYALTGGTGLLGRPLTQADLRTESPFNTYVIDGLPPEPICNPGKAAIEAVLNPARTDELYFVADGSGGHVFARTLDEHNRNVARWRRLQNEPRGQPPG